MEKTFIIALIFAIIVGLFSLANNNLVLVDFIFTSFQVSQALVILLSTLLGAIIVFSFGLYKNFQQRQRIKALVRQTEELKLENEKLRLESEDLSGQLEKVESLDLNQELISKEDLTCPITEDGNMLDQDQKEDGKN